MAPKTATALVSASGTRRKADRYYLRAVGKAIEILQLLERADSPLPLSEIAAAVRLTKSSLFRVLHTLEVTGCLHRTEDGRYQPADPGRGRVAGVPVARLASVSIEPMKNLMRRFGETVGVAALFDNHIEVIAVVESPQVIRMGNTPGRIIPPHASSLGKCITAFQHEERRERLVHSYGMASITAKTITDADELEREFARIREQGYAMDLEESVLDGNCFGAPVRAATGDVIAAVSTSVPKLRVQNHSRQDVIKGVLDTAAAISSALKRS